MELEFVEGRWQLNGRNSNLPDEQWGKMVLRLRDIENDHQYEVSVGFLLPNSSDVTLEQLDEAAQSRVLAILQESQRLLSEQPPKTRRERALADPSMDGWSWR